MLVEKSETEWHATVRFHDKQLIVVLAMNHNTL